MHAISSVQDTQQFPAAANAACFQPIDFTQQLLALQPEVVRFCLHYLKDIDLAKEVSQEVMLKAFKHAAKFEQRSSIKTWLLSIAYNECTSEYRKLQRNAARFASFDEEHDQSYSSDSEYEADDEAPSNPKLAGIVAGLPDTQQTILRHRFADELGLSEIAERMNLSLSCVKMNYYRALKKIHKIYMTS